MLPVPPNTDSEGMKMMGDYNTALSPCNRIQITMYDNLSNTSNPNPRLLFIDSDDVTWILLHMEKEPTTPLHMNIINQRCDH